ncbi:MAG: WG repeat-containing protein [Bacteroidetes bacterium]|nr:WG repeat-containing protein [Bacteroidota bacterium]
MFSQKGKSFHEPSETQVPTYAFISRHGSVYGLGDSSGWFKNSPTGDSIFHLGNFHFAVRNSNGRYDVYNLSFQKIEQNCKIPKLAWFYIIAEDSGGVRFLNILTETKSPGFDSIYISDNYAWLYKNGKQGIKNLNWPNDSLILPLYDRVGLYHDGILLIRNNKLGWLGSVNIPLVYDHIYMERPDVMAAADNNGTTYYSLSSHEKLNALPTDSVVFYDHHYKRVRGNRQSLFALSDNSLIAEIDKYSIHPFSFDHSTFSNDYCIVSNDSLCALYRHGQFLTGFEYENILDDSPIAPPYFRMVQHGQIGLIDEHGNIILKPQYSDISWSAGNVYEVRKGNLLGLVATNDESIMPIEYSYINLYQNRYATVSKDDRHFGLFDYNARQLVIPCKYDDITVGSTFILTRRLNLFDVYYKGKTVLSDVYDAQIHKNTAKGYKDGKIFIGYVKDETWEVDSYEIPSYKITNRDKDQSLLSGTLSQTVEMYDYASGKWGYYNIPSQGWSKHPVAHSGDSPDDVRLLPLYFDSVKTCLGINFKIRKGLVPLSYEYKRSNASSWLDIYPYWYRDDGNNARSYRLSPVYFTEPGKGVAWNESRKYIMSAAFPGISNRAVYTEGGTPQLTDKGDISLSDYICRLSVDGCTHPQSIADYEKLLDPRLAVIIVGGHDHILDSKRGTKEHISLTNTYDWVHKTDLNYPIIRQNGKYGLLSDSATFILNPVYESLESFPIPGDIVYKVGVRSTAYRVFNPQTHRLSALIDPVIDYKDELLVVKCGDRKKAVMNPDLDTLATTSDSVSLLGHNYFTIRETSGTAVYHGTKKLFTHTQQTTSVINANFFLIQGMDGYMVLSAGGDTLLKSRQLIECPFGNDNFLLNCGNKHHLYSASGKLIGEFEKTPYEFNESGDLVIREKENVRVYLHNKSTALKHPGKFVNLTTKYLTVKFNKTETVYSLTGETLVAGIKNTKALNADYFSYKSGKKNMLMDVNARNPIIIKQPVTAVMEDGFDYLDMSGTTQTILFSADPINKPYITHRGDLCGLNLNEGAMQTKNILPCKYYNIKSFGNYFLVQDHVEYKLFSIYTRAFLSPESYDAVYPYLDYIQTFKKGKIAYLKD